MTRAVLTFRPSILCPSGSWKDLEGDFDETTGILWHDTAKHTISRESSWRGRFGVHIASRTIITVLEEAPAAASKPKAKAA